MDNHTLHNVAFATCDFDTEERWSVYYAVRDIAYAQLRKLPPDEVIVMTNAFTDQVERDLEGWAAVRQLAADRSDRLVAVTLDCALEENIARLKNAERRANRKLTDAARLTQWRSDPA